MANGIGYRAFLIVGYLVLFLTWFVAITIRNGRKDTKQGVKKS